MIVRISTPKKAFKAPKREPSQKNKLRAIARKQKGSGK